MRDITMYLTQTFTNLYTARLQCVEKVELTCLYFNDFTEHESKERIRLGLGELNARCPCGDTHQIAMVRMDDQATLPGLITTSQQ